MIQRKRPLSVKTGLAPRPVSLGQASRILVIEAQEALAQLAPAQNTQSVVLTRKSLLSRSMMQSVQPDAVIGPLITADWDIVDLALVLEGLGFTGDLYAVTQPLPRAELVVREVAAVCPAITVHLLEVA